MTPEQVTEELLIAVKDNILRYLERKKMSQLKR